MEGAVTRRPNASRRAASAGLAGAACLLLAGGLAACASVYPEGPEGDRQLYEAKCGLCHVPFHPSERTAEEWPALVAQFGPRAGLTRGQRVRVLRHLTSGAAGTVVSAEPPGAPSLSPSATR